MSGKIKVRTGSSEAKEFESLADVCQWAWERTDGGYLIPDTEDARTVLSRHGYGFGDPEAAEQAEAIDPGSAQTPKEEPQIHRSTKKIFVAIEGEKFESLLKMMEDKYQALMDRIDDIESHITKQEIKDLAEVQ